MIGFDKLYLIQGIIVKDPKLWVMSMGRVWLNLVLHIRQGNDDLYDKKKFFSSLIRKSREW